MAAERGSLINVKLQGVGLLGEDAKPLGWPDVALGSLAAGWCHFCDMLL
jgi:hypothetical protein